MIAPLWSTITILTGALIAGLMIKHGRARRWNTLLPLSAFALLWAIGITAVLTVVALDVRSYWIAKPVFLIVSFLDVAMIYASFNVEKVAKRMSVSERPPSPRHAIFVAVGVFSFLAGASCWALLQFGL